MIFSDRFKLIMLFMMSTLAYGQSQIYSTPGSYNWVVPPCVTQVTVQVWGGGGGGGAVWSRFSPTDNSSFSAEACTAAGGGGGGGFASRTYTVVPGDSYTIVVGAGGAGGTVNGSGNNRANDGSNGGNSTFSGPATLAPGILRGNGGSGGGAANFLRDNCLGGCWINHEGVNGAGGNGGTGQNGTTNFSGGSGRSGVHAGNTEDRSGAGGGGAGSTQNGSNATATGNTGTGGGAGGAPEGGVGAGGIKQPYGSGYLGTNGLNGNTLGGGGGGACGHNRQASSSSHRSNIGGNGARGEVRILYTSPSLTEPTFTAVSPICAGETLSALPTTSNNGINGTWSPALNNSSTTTYVFTPDPSGPCADTASLRIVVNPATTPTFNQVAPICSGGSFTLPTTSSNGINGSWSPAINNTATTIYTFTPTAGQCATTTTMSVTVNQQVTPIFTQVPMICSGGSFTLPTTSTNGINGSWSPAINNTATTTYTFTPTAGQCAITTTMTVSVGAPNTPVFTQITPICTGGSFTLPTTSNDGYTGVWTPSIDNTSTTTYTFTPDPGQCAMPTNMTVTVNPEITPTFNQIAPICSGESFTLPTTSNNGINGTWSPAINNLTTTDYTFTPTAGQCATTALMTVTVTDMPYAELIPDVTTGSSGLIVNFENNSSASTNYFWDFGNGTNTTTTTLISTSSTYIDPGTYTVILSASNGVCTDYDTVQIVIINNEPTIVVPNVFTPNGDTSNDQFFIDAKFTSNIKYIIVNRWGNLMFEADGINPLWDGTSNGKPVEEGVYFYKYEVLGINGETYTGHGNVTLIRD